ncbi:MAG: hypothetical protein UX98_C0018G0017 [Parcubacteria group bacterium GW2011_GWA2_47_26]|nr:MAG: hypothetical protein UX98_C0018G0017 [Parcubacteria group bacterium GW2011_GWA2_47_26]
MKGLTLIELVTTVGLMVLAAGIISAVYLRSVLPSTNLRAVRGNLAANLRYAAELATTTQINHAVRFDPQNSRYELVRLTIPEVIIKSVTLPSQVTITSTTFPLNTVTFNVLGATAQAGSVDLRHNSNETMTVEVRPSGYVRTP